MFGEEGFAAIVQSELGDKNEPIHFEIGRERVGKYVGAGGASRGVQFYTVFITEIFAAEGEPEPGHGVQVEIERRAPPGVSGRIVVGFVAGSVDRSVEAQAEGAAGFCIDHEVVLMDLVVADVTSSHIVEEELEIVAGGIAILGDQVFIALPAGRNAPVVGGIGDTDHESVFSKGEV